ncbi:carboxylating nicotinate-nucleotide diphosphorylase [Peptoniphilus equinus]|uniref:nicotinate-nucleotide diphosphorylase (carboxylating) n=1 Tax=Peptoniphilus equinus TaxID=3016343 RepID=A0ABY7QUQ8_9FIRM|nr:carboxylating nicotinate-nucleotide diphosphorylase [Peptoniphilus equinus]WBW50524.1 carboxylating nicotinate-nucleotide diphosphorylase [Peptoniphilus equinus]
MKGIEKFLMDEALLRALKEDVTYEDVTTASVFKENARATVELISKDEGILAGLEVFRRTFLLLDPQTSFDLQKSDGDAITKQELLGTVTGSVHVLLTAERVALNMLQRMSGVATYAHKMVTTLDDPHTKIVDTRKTTPGLRIFEKYAVTVGGASNHRYNLSDAILLKDNHIGAAGSVAKAIAMARDYASITTPVEIEVESLELAEEAVNAGADIIMLDNMDVASIKEAVALIGGRSKVELSGNINLDNVANYRGLGADFISSGAITHSAKILDLSMKHLKVIEL